MMCLFPFGGIANEIDKTTVMPLAHTRIPDLLEKLSRQGLRTSHAAFQYNSFHHPVSETHNGLAHHRDTRQGKNQPGDKIAALCTSAISVIVRIYGDDIFNAGIVFCRDQ